MQAILINDFVSDLADLKPRDTQLPKAKANELQIRITHAALTHVDTLYAQGLHQNNQRHVKPPFILGTEFAGVVTSSSSSSFKPGTRVFGGGLGSYAESICVAEGSVRQVPEQWTNADACAVGASGAVGWGSLIFVAKLKQGETALILGASGGLGVMAIQIAKAVGAKVIAVVGKDKAQIVKGIGADAVVDYRDADWENKVKALTEDGEGVHVVYDAIGAIESGLKCLRYRGRLVIVGFAARGGQIEQVRANRMLLKSATVHGYRFGEDGRRFPEHTQTVWDGFMEMVKDGKIQPVIYGEEYRGLNSVPRAMKDLNAHKVWGRAILRINEAEEQELQRSKLHVAQPASMSGYGNHSGSESEDDEVFNPAPMVDEDDLAPAANARRKASARADDEDDEDQASGAKPRAGDDEDEEDGAGDEDENDDEEDEDDEDEDDEDEVRPHKRRKKARRNIFVDLEAEVDDEDEEEEEGDDEIADEVHPDDLLEPTGADLDDSRHRDLDRTREVNAQKDAEQLARELDEKYRRREQQRQQRAAAGIIPIAIPTINDPSIWVLKCRPGKEREIVLSITKRMDEQARLGKIPKVYSAFERGGGMGGYLYVEADSKTDLQEMLDGVANVFMGTDPKSIAVKERPDLVKKRKRPPLEEGKFVRMVRPPLYKGDLAKVVEVHANGLDCTVQLVPRLDYGHGEDANASVDGGKRKRVGFAQPKDRPPQKLFSETEAKKRHMKHLSMSGSGASRTFTYKGDDYQNGFLIKDVKVNFISTENVNPRMEEMQFFSTTSADGTETLDLMAVQAAQKAGQTGASFATGDNVEIFDGEQKGLRGTTVSVTGDIITLRVTEGNLKGRTIDAPVKILRKLFRDGDHVKVIGGSKYVDEVGMVTKIKDDKVTLLCDSTQEEITVFSKDLKRAVDAATLGSDSPWDLMDFVQIDATTVGVIVKVDREIVRVMDQNNNIRSFVHSQVSSVVSPNRNAVATDRDGSEIHKDDRVKEVGGENRDGKVLYIHRGILFLESVNKTEQYGVFVARSNNVLSTTLKGGQKAMGPDLGKINPALLAGANGTAMPPPQRPMGRDKLIGKTVSVRKGPHKGLLGIVKDTMGDEVRLELHTKSKHISIHRTLLTVKDPLTGQAIDMGANKFPNRARGGFSGATPNHNSGSRTPSWGNTGRGGGGGSSGPSWGGGSAASGGRTPGWGGGAGGRTPAWGGDGGRTAYGGDGGRTAYGGDGSRTAYGGGATAYGGATSYGGATAYGGGDGSRTAYGGFNAGGRTPGGPSWGNAPSKSSNNLSAPTPGGYNAPTPAPYSAPTPSGYGGYSAPTPGGPMDAPTPGYSAPTPGDSGAGPTPRGYGGYGATPAAAPTPGAWADTPWGGGPETPAPSGMDEEPGYN
ncbi:hypothetical protein P154DRAFT_550441 [Amniculicola lignicola CBS 123094]|uniref:Transcription elongation factor SPT5 n=1 Tax=Amniculicola lignicola CBS 123094 TaxID=1392246 RepID=A0A6A5X3A7_9PLEO|nr:hypothetical protein P154DRAFT_550441 [Amniculicola lignicola CBS 123094]